MQLSAISLAACSTQFSAQSCRVDDDCGQGLVCEQREGLPVCVRAEDAPLIIGESAPISGINQALGTAMKLGVELAFKEKNAAGGVRGRELMLEFRDDAYQPEVAEAATRALADVQVTRTAPRCPTTAAGQDPISTTALERGPRAVLAFLGNVGTPTMMRAAPVAIETGTIFFGAFTGADAILRDESAAACKRFIFNVRASYAQEARATMEYFHHQGISDARHLISFDQDDAFGQAGYDGLNSAYAAVIGSSSSGLDGAAPIARFRYTRNDDSSVPAQAALAASYLAALLGSDKGRHAVGVLMTNTYGAGAAFIEALRGWQFASSEPQLSLDAAHRLELIFSHLSFVGPNALADRLVAAGTLATPSGPKPLTTHVIVSQVVPNYESDESDVVRSYQAMMSQSDSAPSFTSLEGYIAARLFIAGLDAHEGPFQPDALVSTFERLPELSLGLGASSGFSPTNHQYSDSVWGTTIEPDGSFRNLYFWSAEVPIQFFE